MSCQRRVEPGSIASPRLMAAATAIVLALLTRPAAAEPADRPPLIRQHGLGLGYHAITFGTAAGDQYALHGPSVVYDYFRGRRWGFMMRLSGAYLVAGSMSGPSGDFSGGLGAIYDQRRLGADVTVGMGRRHALTPRLAITGAAGLHVQGFSLTGTRYSPVEDISIGLGGMGKLDYPLNGWLSLTGQLAVGLDPFDLVEHANPAGWVIPFSSTFALAARHY